MGTQFSTSNTQSASGYSHTTHNEQTPLSSTTTSGSSQPATTNHLQPHNKYPRGGVSTNFSNHPGVHQISQRLTQYQLAKQNLAHQLAQAKSSSSPSSQQQLLVLQLNQVNSNIASLSQQLQLVSQIPQQPAQPQSQYKGGKRISNGMMQHGSSMGYHNGGDLPQYQPAGNIAPDSTDLVQSMHKVSFGRSISHNSAIKTSRLHQIISGEQSQDETDGKPSTMISESGDPGPHPSLPAKLTSVDDIPEFKPGVPWQPRPQTKEPAQAFSTQNSQWQTSSSFNSGATMPGFNEESKDYNQWSSYNQNGFSGPLQRNHNMGGKAGNGFEGSHQYGVGYNSGRGYHGVPPSGGVRRSGKRNMYQHGGNMPMHQPSGPIGSYYPPGPSAGHYPGRSHSQTHQKMSSYNDTPQPHHLPRGFESKNWSAFPEGGNPWSSKGFQGMCNAI